MSKFDINFIITKFPCQASTDSGEEITVMDALLEIKSGKYAAEIERLRAGEEQVKRLELPAYSFHARFDGARLKSSVSELSGLVIIDIDDIDGDLEEIRAEIASNCESCLAIIISPSGTGLKCLYLVPEENICVENYRQFGREISKKFGKYGKTDTLSLTDCLIASCDENIYINEGAVEDIFIEIKDVKKVHEKLPELDKSKVLFDDPQEFYELVLLDEILERSDNNFHFIQMSVFELAKFGFYGDIDYDFILEHCPKQDAKSAPHKLQEAIEAAADIEQTAWPYDYRELPSREIGKTREYNDDGIPKEIENVSEFDYADIGVVDYSKMYDKFLEVLVAGNKVGAEISLPNFAEAFRWDYGVTVITGIPSFGKSEWVDQNIIDLARLHGWKTGIAGFEQTEEEHIMKMVRKVLGFDVRKNKADDSELKNAYEFVVDHIKHVDVEKTGGDIDNILEVFENMMFVYEMRNFVIDPFNLLSIKSKSAGHEKLEEMIRKMVIFCKKHRVSIMLVAHPTKMKKKEDGTFEVPDLYSVKGTSAFYEMAYHGMVVHRIESDDTDKVMVKVLKVKQNNLGERNKEVFFLYDLGSGRYIPINEFDVEIKSDCREKNWHKHLDK